MNNLQFTTSKVESRAKELETRVKELESRLDQLEYQVSVIFRWCLIHSILLGIFAVLLLVLE